MPSGITMVYHGDGNRVKKTVAGVTTTYLVDTQNPTGYAQVIFETFSGGSGNRELSHRYVYGLERITQFRSYQANNQGLTQTSYYVYDGHGSTRALTDPNGNVTDTYDYDAFGNLLHSTGTTFNEFLFAGEQFDSDLNLYYNRARYLNVSTGRFLTMDSFEGASEDPPSLHKYLYAGEDPVDRSDRSGRDFGLADVSIASAIGNTLNAIEANIGTSTIQGLQCAQEDTCKDATTGAVFALAFNALAATVFIGAISVVGKFVKQVPLRFSQITASRFFSDEGTFAGETIGSLAFKLRKGQISPAAVRFNISFEVRGDLL